MRFTIFTPTYNRREYIHRVFESLQAQTYRDFEWIVVDDGSTDNSRELIESFIETAEFPCRLLVQSRNSGKHMAWNWAVREARGQLFVIADSDDGFVPESLELMLKHWDSIPADQQSHFAGINVLCQNSETGAVVGDPYPSSPFDSNSLELAYVHRIHGEKWGCVRTDLLREVPFPATGGSHFAENYVWMTLARKYQTRCVNDKLRIFFDDQRPDRLTQERGASTSAARFEAAYSWNALHLNNNWDYILRNPRELIVTIANLERCGLILGKSSTQTAGTLKDLRLQFLFWMVAPLGYLLYRRDISRRRVTVAA